MTISEAYEHLSLKEGASEAEVKKSYKKMALKYHPDKNPTNREEANKKFLVISEAYKRITEPESFKDDEDGFDMDGMDEEAMQAMFNMMMSEMMGGFMGGGMGGDPFGGMGGGIPLDILEQMMGGELDSDDEDDGPLGGMGGGGYDFIDEEDLFEAMMGGGPMADIAAMMGGGPIGRAPVAGGRAGGRSNRREAPQRGVFDMAGIPSEEDMLAEMMEDMMFMGGPDELLRAMGAGGRVGAQSKKNAARAKQGQQAKSAKSRRPIVEESDDEDDEDEWETASDESDDDDDYLEPGMMPKTTNAQGKKNRDDHASKNKERQRKEKEKELDAEYAMYEKMMGNNISNPEDIMKLMQMSHLDAYSSDDEEGQVKPGNKGYSPPRNTKKGNTSTGNASKDSVNINNKENKSINGIKLGDRVMINGNKGKVAYIGPVAYAGGDFVGVIMNDKTKGKNNGTVKGLSYFECAPGAGLMCKVRDVTKCS